MKSKATTDEVKNYYDGFLGHLKYDHIRENPRHARIKKDLGGIIKKEMNVLDLGCGTGITTKYIAELGAKVIGIDISPKLIQFAKRNSDHQNIEYRIGDITDFTLDKKYFDVICLIDIMEHIPRAGISHLIKNIERHSCNNTVIYLNIPDARFQCWMREKCPGRLQIIDEAYSMTEILELLNSINFEIIKIKIYGIDLPVQYVSYIFVRKDTIIYNYKKYFRR